jgi:hypothetical protein
MKMNLQAIFQVSNVIGGIKPDEVSFKLYYRLCKISKKFQSLSGLYADLRQAIVTKNAKKDKDDKPIIVGQSYEFEDVEKLRKEMNELNDKEEEIEFEKIPESLAKELNIPVAQMAWLMEIIEEPKETK